MEVSKVSIAQRSLNVLEVVVGYLDLYCFELAFFVDGEEVAVSVHVQADQVLLLISLMMC